MLNKIKKFAMNNLIFVASVIIFLGLTMPFILQYCYFGTLTLMDIKTQGKLGPVSDWISGIFTPCIALASFLLLYMTYASQKEELELTRRQMEKQSQINNKQQFEATFFQMISLYKDNLEEIEYLKQHGRKSIIEIYRFFKLNYDIISKVDNPQNWNYTGWTFPKSEKQIVAYAFELTFGLIDDEVCTQLFNKAMGTLYQILQLINDAEFNNIDKRVYIDIIRSQLSLYEFTILFYDSLVGNGIQHGEIWYDLGIFRKGNFIYLLNKDHFNLYDEYINRESEKMVPIV